MTTVQSLTHTRYPKCMTALWEEVETGSRLTGSFSPLGSGLGEFLNPRGVWRRSGGGGDGEEGTGRKGAEEEHCINSLGQGKGRRQERRVPGQRGWLAGTTATAARTGAPGLNLGDTFGGLKRASDTAW